MVIVIAGALASGKTTISKEVAKRLNGEYISVDQVLTDHKLDQLPWGSYSIPLENFLTANTFMRPMITAALAANKPAIVDGCFYFREALDDLLRDVPQPHRIFTLSAPLEVCIERDRLREKPLGEEAARGVYHLTSKLTLGESVDSTQPTDKVIQAIIDRVSTSLVPPRVVRLFQITKVLMYILAAAWVVFSVSWFFRGTSYRVLYTVMGFGFAAAMILLALLLRRRWAQWVTLILLGLNIILTITDQVGWVDWVYLIPSLAVFGCLIIAMKEQS